MRRLLLVAAAIVAIATGAGTGTVHAATKSYSTGNINVQIGTANDRTIDVPDAGPVSFVRVSFRIAASDTSALSISLVSPQGTEIPLVSGRGGGADFGSGEKGCGGVVTVLDSDLTTNPISSGSAPFTDNPYRADGNLTSLYGQEARGRWTLRVRNDGAPARLHCLTLDISRAVPETLRARERNVSAFVTFMERNYFFEQLRLKIVRAGMTVVDAPIQKVGCRDCIDYRPVSVVVRDLDGGEPEVLVDLFSGGAHCCSFTLILRYDQAAKRYRSTLAYWGNYGSRLGDLDRDRRPEFSAFDERFVYTFTAYVFSAAPIQIWRYRQGKLVDDTRSFPALIRKDAAAAWKTYLKGRDEKDVDVRAYVAAYVADEYLLGRPREAKRALDLALKRGDLGQGKELRGTPAGTAFVAELMKDLSRWGYIR